MRAAIFAKGTKGLEGLLWLLLLLAPLVMAGQLRPNGAARALPGGCFTFQPNAVFRAGTVWDLRKISLRDTFDLSVSLYFGCGEEGPEEGLAFIFQNITEAAGSYHGNMGFENLRYTLAVEIDLHGDAAHHDPPYHHLAIVAHGRLDHKSPDNLAGPVPAQPGQASLRDCQTHELRVVWNPGFQRLEVFFDCEPRLSYQGDLIGSIFEGEELVFWGFASGSRGRDNAIELCLPGLQPLDEMEDLAICRGESVVLRAPRAGLAYSWQPSRGLNDPTRRDPAAAPDSSITYMVTITGDCGRRWLDTVFVEVIEGPERGYFGSTDLALCEGASLTLGREVPGALGYGWSTGAVTPVIAAAEAGVYTLEVSLDNGCVFATQFLLREASAPIIPFGVDTVLCEGETLELVAGAAPGEVYLWQDGATSARYRVVRPGWYAVTVGNACGEAERAIEVRSRGCGKVYLPNVFSPNGDGVNDLWYPLADGGFARVRRLLVFDRWGGLCFVGRDFPPGDPAFGWDGRVRGAPAPGGVYVYLLEMERWDGGVARLEGTVLLVRG
jgi:gliding motility-associated-like protein